jgi:hypothetical protein
MKPMLYLDKFPKVDVFRYHLIYCEDRIQYYKISYFVIVINVKDRLSVEKDKTVNKIIYIIVTTATIDIAIISTSTTSYSGQSSIL